MMCNKLRWSLLALGLITVGIATESSLAAPRVFFRRDHQTTFMTNYPKSLASYNRFTASLNEFGVDDIDFAAGFDPELTFGTTGITATANGTLAQAAPGFMIGAQALLEQDAAIPGQVNTRFTLNQPVNAFGLYGIQGGDGANNNPITFRLRDTSDNSFVDVTAQVGPQWGTSNAFFFGVHSDVPFDEVELIEAIDLVDGMLYDNVVAGFVPEPGSLMLVMLGGACALGRVRRRRN